MILKVITIVTISIKTRLSELKKFPIKNYVFDVLENFRKCY